ncbi:hypothetical protein G4V62_14020 [Bacillaceae bacterium SIJ1]|uniref:YqaJ viral recombinase family nuclease n=1 Tax=Litoribacterium kuwaitense TaxID=1398745 RepID=UPI0013E9A1A3|nr:YqaJ viral recombinase family protein [Litoribacterium kuwaitense]NGP46010.1 hypothetical protein [Litoribacterium kuwaitense]
MTAPNVLIPTKEMNRVEWLKNRRQGIGGSDASAILGLNKYSTAFEVWSEKTGDYIPEDVESEAAYFGNLLEDMVAKEFENRTGKRVRRRNAILQHPKHEWMIANVDRMVVGEKAILECKTANQRLASDWEGEDIPAQYLVQIQHYMAVLGAPKAYIAVLIGGQRFVWKEIERDEELIEMMIAEEKRFWEEHVLAGVPPALDGTSAAEKYMKERFPEAVKDTEIALSASYKEQLEYRDQLKEQLVEIQQEITKIENRIKLEMKENEKATLPGFQITWKNRSSMRVDAKRLKQEQPDIYETYLKESISRPLLVKAVE